MSVPVRQIASLVSLSLLELYRRKDLFVVFVLSAVILLPLSLFKPFGITGASRYLNELTLLLVWLFSLVIGLGVSARMFPSEFESRTIFPLLAKPAGRGVILVGRYLGALTAAVSALAIFYLAYGVLVGVRQGEWFPVVMVQAFILHVGFLIVVTAVGLAGSLFLTASANLTVCMLLIVGMLLFGQRLPVLMADQPIPGKWVLGLFHWLGPHVELFDLRQRVVHDWPPVRWSVCAMVLAYAAAYASACLALALCVFRRKRL